MIVIKSKLEYGDIVYLKTDSYQNEHIVTGILGRPGCTKYIVSHNREEIEVHDFEITTEYDEVKALGDKTNGE